MPPRRTPQADPRKGGDRHDENAICFRLGKHRAAMEELARRRGESIYEAARQACIEFLASHAQDDPAGPSWDVHQVYRDFTFERTESPFVIVTRRSDGQRGTLEFSESEPDANKRVYRNFTPEEA